MPRPQTRNRLLVCLFAGLATTVAFAWLPALYLPDSAVSLASTGTTLANGPVVAERDGFMPAAGYLKRRGGRTYTLIEVSEPFLVRAPAGGTAAPRVQPAATPWGAAAPNIQVRLPSPPPWQDLAPGWAMHRASEVLHSPPTGSMPSLTVSLEARGWPFRAVLYECVSRYDAELTKSLSMRGGWTIPHPRTADFAAVRGHGVTLPLVPIWGGLAADSALFSLAWCVPVFGLPAGRRFLRGRRGRCMGCSYDLRGLPTDARCPECGRVAGSSSKSVERETSPEPGQPVH